MNPIKFKRRIFSKESFAIGPCQATQVARLLQTLADGERVAANIAKQQANLCQQLPRELTWMHQYRNFFLLQCKQESFHHRVFQLGILCLRPKGIKNQKSYFNDLEYLLLDKLHNKQLLHSISRITNRFRKSWTSVYFYFRRAYGTTENGIKEF